jgi:glycosyltransferase involved in cell wall biosynthesis
MYCSGTSSVASVLSALGIDLGRELLPPDSKDVRDYFEDSEFGPLQRTILSACCPTNDGGHPDWGWTESESLDKTGFKEFLPEASALIARRSARSTPWGWKDSRTTLLLEFWDQLVDDARYVFVYRFPWDVADSMQRLGAEVFLRNPEYGYRIWEFYNRRILDFYVKHSERCLLVSANALRANLFGFTGMIRSKFGIQIPSIEMEEIYDDGLFNANSDTDPLIDLVAAVWPSCTQLLSELDGHADISALGLWQARPVCSGLTRPDSSLDGGSIDVSVVTPCYNQGVLLVEAIASVERFAPSDCELIIINDGSEQPRTLEILEILKRCGYFILDQPNQGLSAARNRAIEMARGRYILPLDDDNRIRANFIQDAIRVLDSSPEVGVVYGDRYEFGLRSGEVHIPAFDLAVILTANYIDACAVFRRKLWEDCGGYDSRMSPTEDWELWVHAAQCGWRFHHVSYLAFDYRVRPNSLITTCRLEDLREEILAKHLLHDSRGSRKLVAAIEHTIEASHAQIATLSNQLATLSTQLSERDAELASIRGSRGWKLLERYRRIKYRYLLPFYRLLASMPEPQHRRAFRNPEREPDKNLRRLERNEKSTVKLRIPERITTRVPILRLAKRATALPSSIQFFVIGSGRCGSTLIRDLLNLHPDMYVPSESHWIPIQHEMCGQRRNALGAYTDVVERVFFADGVLTVDAMAAGIGITRTELFEATRARLNQETSTVVEFNDALYCALAAAAGRSVVGDKTPDYCAYVTLIQSLWPKAKFIHVIRDGRDVALSMSKHPGYQRMASLMIPNWVPLALDKRYAMTDRLNRVPTLKDYIGLWDLRIRRTLDDAGRLPAHSYFGLRYENLLQDPQAEATRLAEFLDVSRPQQWLAQVKEIVRPGNTNKLRDRAVWESLTATAHDTLAELGYPI